MHKHELSNYNRLYDMVELYRLQVSPVHAMLAAYSNVWSNPLNHISSTFFGSYLRASFESSERLLRKYSKPEFGINSTISGGSEYRVEEIIEQEKSFCNLLHFRKRGIKNDLPKLLIVAPLAGHHATLLRNTVIELLPYFDVFITDWKDAAYIPLSEGDFTLDDYIDYMIEFFQLFNERINVLAVCQPTVPVLAAAAIMSDAQAKYLPQTLVLIGGPIDVRKNLTQVNDFALDHNLEWFKKYMITTVPANYPGAGRKVFPGFLQLSGFLSMNIQKHIDAHKDFFYNVLINDKAKILSHTKFYDEYLSVLDLPASFYIQTIEEVFQQFSLAKGKMVSRNRQVDVSSMKNVAILGIEGEKDDISAVGQTLAVIDLCDSIPKSEKKYHLQPGAGHYGIFSGSKFKADVVPVIRDFIYSKVGKAAEYKVTQPSVPQATLHNSSTKVAPKKK